MKEFRFELKANVIDELEAFSAILKKDKNTILNEALELYFNNAQEHLMRKNQEDESALTNLDFDEFWEDVDI